MSLLSVCQAACYEIGLDAPSSIVNNNDDDAKQLLYLANRAGEELSRRGTWQALHKEHTITLATGTQTYALPADWRWIIPDTTWDRANQRQADNPITPQEWQMLKGWTQVGGLNRRMRIRNDFFEFEQPITSSDNGNTVALEYLSSYWTEYGTGVNLGTARRNYIADTDIAKIDEELITLGIIWRLQRAKGLDWETAYQEYDREMNKLFGYDRGAKKLRLCGRGDAALSGRTQDGNFGL